ncbi:MAG: hypothetical protein ACE5HV_16340 [Acidobacteriota bacterium]
MRKIVGGWTSALVVLAVGSALLFAGCAETMMMGDKGTMKKEGGMMKKEGETMKEKKGLGEKKSY